MLQLKVKVALEMAKSGTALPRTTVPKHRKQKLSRDLGGANWSSYGTDGTDAEFSDSSECEVNMLPFRYAYITKSQRFYDLKPTTRTFTATVATTGNNPGIDEDKVRYGNKPSV